MLDTVHLSHPADQRTCRPSPSRVLHDPSCVLQVLFWKKRAEEAIQRSGLDYTIVRPGGLTDEPRGREGPGRIVMAGPDTFGLPPRKSAGSILRRQVCLCLGTGRRGGLVGGWGLDCFGR